MLALAIKANGHERDRRIVSDLDILRRLAVALAIGLLVGLERGWRLREVADGQRAAGLRTFALVGLLGGIAGALSHSLNNLLFLGLSFLGFAGTFSAFHLLESKEEGKNSVTGVVSGLLVFLLGAYAVIGEERVAVATGVAATLLLALRDPLHDWLKRLQWVEIRAVLILATMSFLALPILPNRTIDPWNTLNPAEIWVLAIMIAAISFGGYVAVRVLGEKRGIIVAAVAGGLASSTATTLTLSRVAKEQPTAAPLLAAGILLAGMVSVARVMLIALVLNRALLVPLGSAAGAALLLMGAASLFLLFREGRVRREDTSPTLTLSNPLELGTALKLAAFIAVVLVGAELIQRFVGNAGLLLAAAAAGIADVDAITVAMARLGEKPDSLLLAANAILLAVGVNMVAKTVMAGSIGGRRMGWLVGGPSVLAVMVALAVVLLGFG